MLETCSVEKQELINSLDYEKRGHLIAFLKIYLTLGLDLNNLVLHWSDIEKIGKDSSSLEANVLRYGKEHGTKMFKKKSKDCSITRDKLVSLYGEKQTKEMLTGRAGKIESYIKRHGEILGVIKWNEYCEKRRATYLSKRGTYSSHNLAWFKNKYGEDEGYKIWDKKRKSQGYRVSTEYYIDRYGETIGKELIRKCKARDLPFFIKKYGTDKGALKYNSMMESQIKRITTAAFRSKWSLEVLALIREKVYDLYYYGKNELFFHLDLESAKKLRQRVILPDLFYRGGIIEFQGDVFHGNPDIFESSETPHPYNKELTVKRMHEIDKIKHEFYNKKGYEVLEIWEKEWKTQPKIVLQKCLEFLIPRMK